MQHFWLLAIESTHTGVICKPSKKLAGLYYFEKVKAYLKVFNDPPVLCKVTIVLKINKCVAHLQIIELANCHANGSAHSFSLSHRKDPLFKHQVCYVSSSEPHQFSAAREQIFFFKSRNSIWWCLHNPASWSCEKITKPTAKQNASFWLADSTTISASHWIRALVAQLDSQPFTHIIFEATGGRVKPLHYM